MLLWIIGEMSIDMECRINIRRLTMHLSNDETFNIYGLGQFARELEEICSGSCSMQ